MTEHDQPEHARILRSFDPAADAHASDDLTARVAAIPDAASPSPAPLRQTRRWLVPVAAAAALLVGVGGGFALGTGALTGTSTDQPLLAGAPVPVETGSALAPAPPVSLGDSGGSERALAGDGGGGTFEMTTGPQASTADTVSPWHFSNKRRFALPAFDQAPGAATVYAVDARARYSADDAARIAAALGVEGEPTQEEPEYGWTVGSDEPSTPTVWLYPSGGADVSYDSGLYEPWSQCYADIGPRYDLNDASEEVYRQFDGEVQACVSATPMPTEQQARDALSLFLSATGVDEEATQITVTPDEESRTMVATAARVVEGNATQVTSSVTVSAAGFLSAWGSTGTIVSLGEYDIVSPSEAAARLNDPAFAPNFAASTSVEIRYDDVDSAPTEPPAVPSAGAPVPWGITDFEISAARLGLGLMSGTDGAQFLAPAYEFTDTQGNVWSVIALAEADLDTSGGGNGFGWWGVY